MYNLDEDDAVAMVMRNMMDKQVVKKNFTKDLGLDPLSKQKDPRNKMELRHQQVWIECLCDKIQQSLKKHVEICEKGTVLYFNYKCLKLKGWAGERSGSISDSRARGLGFDTRSSHILSFLHPLIQEGQLSVTGESLCTKYWLNA